MIDCPMRVALCSLAFLVLAACGAKEKPVSEPGEKLHPLRGVILSRSASDNSLRIEHSAIPGFMEAMTMEFPVRGAKVDALPADKTRVEATLHVTDRSLWITDVKPVP